MKYNRVPRGLWLVIIWFLGLLAATPAAQGQFWVLVNGVLNYTGPATASSFFAPVLGIGGTSATAATVEYVTTKTVTGLADAVATTVFTITVPNASHAAVLKVKAIGSLGAGGAVGAYEASMAGDFTIGVTRVVNVAAVSAATSLSATASVTSAGAATCTLARSLAAWSGATNDVNTQAIQMTVTRGSGTSTNHVVQLHITVLNANANGVTVS